MPSPQASKRHTTSADRARGRMWKGPEAPMLSLHVAGWQVSTGARDRVAVR